MTTYTPKPGSVADRAIAHLQSQPPAGAEVSTSALAEAVGATGDSIRMCLQPALDAGAVFARKRGGHVRSPMFWSIKDHSLPVNGSPSRPLTLTVDTQGLPDEVVEQLSKPERLAREAAQEAPAASQPKPEVARRPAPKVAPATPDLGLRIALWSDGTLQIQRDAADLVLLTAAETRALVRYLERLAVEEGNN